MAWHRRAFRGFRIDSQAFIMRGGQHQYHWKSGRVLLWISSRTTFCLPLCNTELLEARTDTHTLPLKNHLCSTSRPEADLFQDVVDALPWTPGDFVPPNVI
jgi:hypothetical protein